MRFVNDHELEVGEFHVAFPASATGEQRLLTGDHHLGRPPFVLFRLVLSHLNCRVQPGDVANLVDRLPHQFTQRADDQRPAFDTISQRAEDDRLPGAGEESIQRGLHTRSHGSEVVFNS